MQRIARSLIPILATVIALAAGCDEDREVAQVAREAANRQAEQNRQIAKQNQEISGTTKALVEADAQARKEVLAAQKQLQSQQAEVGHQRDQLEAERKEIAAQRQWDSILAAAVTAAAALLACLLPVALSWYLLRTLHDERTDPELTAMLVAEVASPEPRLFPPAATPLPALTADPLPSRALLCPSAPAAKENHNG